MYDIGVDIGFGFKCSKDRGAVLVLREPAFETSVSERSSEFKQYMLDNYPAWLDFARKEGVDCSWDELIFVRGTIKTTPSWAAGVYVCDGRLVSASFGLAAGGIAKVGFDAKAEKRFRVPFHSRVAPTSNARTTNPTNDGVVDSRNTTDDHIFEWPEDAVARDKEIAVDGADQCIFLRCFMLKRKWLVSTSTWDFRAAPASDLHVSLRPSP